MKERPMKLEEMKKIKQDFKTVLRNLQRKLRKLQFTSNKETLKNPELVEKIVEDIKEQQDGMPNMNFVFCLHVGTTQVERILTTRPGFMEGRVGSVKEALQPADEIPGVKGLIADEFMHFQSTRFAGLIMLAYGGEI